MEIRTLFGPWFSLGIHVDIYHKHIDLHIAWWIIVIGNTESSVHCGECGKEIAYSESEFEAMGMKRCPYCEAEFGTTAAYE